MHSSYYRHDYQCLLEMSPFELRVADALDGCCDEVNTRQRFKMVASRTASSATI